MCNDAQLMCAELVEQTLAPACETLRIGSDGSKEDPEPDVEAADGEAPADRPEGALEEVRDRVKQRVDRAFADPVEQKMIRGLGSNPRAAQEEFEKRFDELIAARAAYSRYDLIERLTSDEAEAARAKLEEAVCAARRQLVGVSLALPSGQEEFESEDRALNAVQRCRTL
jgi:acyl transferase domain-containing protein